MTAAHHPTCDLLAVGFGPSSLALAIAVEEHNARAPGGRRVSARFFERQRDFGWHRGMLLERTTMQVSFLKDPVTQRNPTSDFGFLSYLHAHERLPDFINHKTLFPSRLEFHDYLQWIAQRLDHLVEYGADVVALRPVRRDGRVVAIDVQVADRDGQRTWHRGRNVVLATGLRPAMPDGVRRSARVWHSSELAHRLDDMGAPLHGRFVVVGSGQSAAEVADHLHHRHPDAEVCAVFRRYGYAPADDSPFANRIFDPGAVDEFYEAEPDVKALLLDYHRNTNYSVVDGELIAELYRTAYEEKVAGRQRLRIMHASRVEDVEEHADGVRVGVDFLPHHERTRLDADVVVFATGYRPADPRPLLGELGAACHTDDAGRLAVERDYRVRTDPEVSAGIYLQGGTEHSHGLSSSLLSNSAVRAGEILASIRARSSAATRAPATAGVTPA